MVAAALLTAECKAADAQSGVRVDDILHSSLSFSATASGSQLARILGVRNTDALLVGVGGAVTLGLGKEAFDHLRYGGWSWRDMTANAVGIAAAAGLQLCLDALSRRRANRGPRAGSTPRGVGLATQQYGETGFLPLDRVTPYRNASGTSISGGGRTGLGSQARRAGHNDAVHLDDAHFSQLPSPQENESRAGSRKRLVGRCCIQGHAEDWRR